MKKKIVYVLCIFIIFILFVLTKNLIIDRPEDTGRLRILSSPKAGIFIDSVPLGSTPFESRYKPGEYTVKLIPEGDQTNAVSWEGKIEVLPHTLTYVIRELGNSEVSSGGEMLTIRKSNELKKGEFGGVSVSSTPPGAIVSLGSEDKGISPIKLTNVSTGEYELSVYLPGFIKRTQKIVITKGHIVDAQFNLSLDPDYKTIDELIKENEKKEASAQANLSLNSLTPSITPIVSKKIIISNTETGFLNVRKEPRITSQQIDQVKEGEEYVYDEVINDWYKIVLKDGSKGWVTGQYVKEM
jgi:hypothetical protein